MEERPAGDSLISASRLDIGVTAGLGRAMQEVLKEKRENEGRIRSGQKCVLYIPDTTDQKQTDLLMELVRYFNVIFEGQKNRGDRKLGLAALAACAQVEELVKKGMLECDRHGQMSVRDLGVSPPTVNMLLKAGVNTVGDILCHGRYVMQHQIRNIGK